MAGKKHPTPEQKGKLKNDSIKDVPSVTMKAAKKAFDAGNVTEADRLLNLMTAEVLKNKRR